MRQRKNLSRGGMTLREEIKQKKGVATLYVVLRILVILVMVAQFLNGNFENVFLCILTLILFLVPTFIERKIHIDLPDTLEVIILLFIFAAEILGEIQAYYITFPYWDTMLHTLNGFLCAAIGFALVDILNRSERFSISSVMLDPLGGNHPTAIRDITDVIVVTADGVQHALGLGGYLDIGILDTMKDLFVNFIGAVVFSVIGYFYVKSRGKGQFARRFIPQVLPAEEEQKEVKSVE